MQTYLGAFSMKAFLTSVIVAVAVAAGAAVVLNTQQKTVAQAFATDGARVGDPGSNLIGLN
jgi:hypothetical protein